MASETPTAFPILGWDLGTGLGNGYTIEQPERLSNSLKDYETLSMDERRDSTKDSTDNSSDSGTIYYATGDFTPLEDNQVCTWWVKWWRGTSLFIFHMMAETIYI